MTREKLRDAVVEAALTLHELRFNYSDREFPEQIDEVCRAAEDLLAYDRSEAERLEKCKREQPYEDGEGGDGLRGRITNALDVSEHLDEREDPEDYVDVAIGPTGWFVSVYDNDEDLIATGRGETKLAALEAVASKLDALWSKRAASALQALQILRGKT